MHPSLDPKKCKIKYVESEDVRGEIKEVVELLTSLQPSVMAYRVDHYVSLYKSVVLPTAVAPGGHTKDHVQHPLVLQVAFGGHTENRVVQYPRKVWLQSNAGTQLSRTY